MNWAWPLSGSPMTLVWWRVLRNVFLLCMAALLSRRRRSKNCLPTPSILTPSVCLAACRVWMRRNGPNYFPLKASRPFSTRSRTPVLLLHAVNGHSNIVGRKIRHYWWWGLNIVQLAGWIPGPGDIANGRQRDEQQRNITARGRSKDAFPDPPRGVPASGGRGPRGGWDQL